MDIFQLGFYRQILFIMHESIPIDNPSPQKHGKGHILKYILFLSKALWIIRGQVYCMFNINPL